MPKHAQLVRYSAVCIALVVALVAVGCGGGSGGSSSMAGSLAISQVTFPPAVSGEAIDFEIPIIGGCGGPYDLNIVSGDLPLGLYTDTTPATATDPSRHHLTGYCKFVN